MKKIVCVIVNVDSYIDSIDIFDDRNKAEKFFLSIINYYDPGGIKDETHKASVIDKGMYVIRKGNKMVIQLVGDGICTNHIGE